MKKIVILILLFIPIIINASISDVFIDSEIDISGNLIVKEIIKIDEKDTIINLYYNNEIGDKIYNSSGIKINKIGLYDGQNESEYLVRETNDYSSIDSNGYYYIKFNEPGNYYIEYTILNICVSHKDSSEFYYRYFNDFNYDIDNLTILTKLPNKSNIFSIYTYNYKSNTTSDNNYYIINKITKFKKGSKFDVRILYDKELFSIVVNKSKISNFNMYKTLNNQTKIYNIYNIVLIIIFLIILLLLLIMDSYISIDISKYNIKSKKIDKNIKIIFLSDLHNRDISYKLKSIIDNEKPDMIIYGGDMINESIDKIYNFIKLDSLVDYKKYYVFGNHECKMNDKDYKLYNKKLNKTSICLLNNKSEYLSKNIKLHGFVSDIDKYKKFGKLTLNKEYIESKVGILDKNNFNILVAHNPLEFNSYVLYGADIVLSGHVHGGEIRLPFNCALFSPDYTLFPKYSSGLYEKNNTKMIVSRGIGFSERLPIRVLNPAEVVIINIMKDN